MRYRIIVWIGVLMYLTLYSCYDVFEEDLTDQQLILKAPYNGAVLSQSEVTFWWSVIEGIQGYELIIANPNFDKVEWIMVENILPVADTVRPENKIVVELSSGVYEWYVSAYNSASETVSDTFKIEILSGEVQE